MSAVAIPVRPTYEFVRSDSVGKTQMVKRFYLGDTTTTTTEHETEAQEKNTRRTVKNSIVAALKANGGDMVMAACFESVVGKQSLKIEIRDELIAEGVIAQEGVPHSKANPSRLRLLKPEWNAGLVIANPTPASKRDMLTQELDKAKASLGEVEAARATVSHPDNPYWTGMVEKASAQVAALEAQIATGTEGSCN